jgi:hypothetical protein
MHGGSCHGERTLMDSISCKVAFLHNQQLQNYAVHGRDEQQAGKFNWGQVVVSSRGISVWLMGGFGAAWM